MLGFRNNKCSVKVEHKFSNTSSEVICLVAELRALEQLGAVERIVFAEIPPRVEYSLTAAGEELVPLLHAVETWCARRTGRVE